MSTLCLGSSPWAPGAATSGAARARATTRLRSNGGAGVSASAGGAASPRGLANAVDTHKVAGEADRARDRHVEEERRAVGAGRLVRHQVGADVLDDVNAVVGNEDVVDDERFLGILAGDDLHGPLVRADGDDLLGREPVCGILADAGFARIEERVLLRVLLEEVEI